MAELNIHITGTRYHTGGDGHTGIPLRSSLPQPYSVTPYKRQHYNQSHKVIGLATA